MRRADGDGRRLLHGVAVDARRDGREGDRAGAGGGRGLDAHARWAEARSSASPCSPSRQRRADGVHDVPGRQPPAPVRPASPVGQPPSVSHSARISGPPRAVDRPVHAAAPEQRLVGGVDDGVDLLLGQVAPRRARAALTSSEPRGQPLADARPGHAPGLAAGHQADVAARDLEQRAGPRSRRASISATVCGRGAMWSCVAVTTSRLLVDVAQAHAPPVEDHAVAGQPVLLVHPGDPLHVGPAGEGGRVVRPTC